MNEMKEYFPDNTPIDAWFYDARISNLESMGKQYFLTEYGICDDGKIYTKEIQALIDTVHELKAKVVFIIVRLLMRME